MSNEADVKTHDINAPPTISDDRLAQICDGVATAFGFEVQMMAAELLARRAGYRQREEAIHRRQQGEAVHQGPPIDGGPFSRRR